MKRQEREFFHGIIVVATIAIGVLNVRGETLLWDRNPESNIVGYRVFYGEANTTPAIIDVGNVTSRTFSNLIAGRSYFFYLKAYNTSGLESDPSQTLNYTKPASAPS